MNTELAELNDEMSLVPDVVNPYDEYKDQIVSATSFLPRVTLFISNSDAVKDEKIQMNHYGLVSNQDIDSLGKEVDVAIISWRPRAIDASDKNNVRVSSDPDSELYREIKEMQDTTQNSGCMYGPEYLIWVPSREKFATLLCGSKTSRNEAPKVHAQLGKPATLKSRAIDNGTYKWQAMVVVPCSTPFPFPSKDMINSVAKDFLVPKEITGAERVKPEEVTARIR